MTAVFGWAAGLCVQSGHCSGLVYQSVRVGECAEHACATRPRVGVRCRTGRSPHHGGEQLCPTMRGAIARWRPETGTWAHASSVGVRQQRVRSGGGAVCRRWDRERLSVPSLT